MLGATRQSVAGQSERPTVTHQMMPLLAGVAPRTARRFLESVKTVRLRRGDSIFEAGDSSKGLYVVVSGCVKLSLPLAASRERVLAILKPGSWFGETSLVLGHAHTETAAAVQHTELAHIPATTFLDCLGRDRRLSAKILAEAFRRLESALADTIATSISARERVVHWILEEAAHANTGDRAELAVPATKRVLASRLHMSAAHLSRMFHELKQAELIEVKGRRICVPSVARLDADRAKQTPTPVWATTR